MCRPVLSDGLQPRPQILQIGDRHARNPARRDDGLHVRRRIPRILPPPDQQLRPPFGIPRPTRMVRQQRRKRLRTDRNNQRPPRKGVVRGRRARCGDPYLDDHLGQTRHAPFLFRRRIRPTLHHSRLRPVTGSLLRRGGAVAAPYQLRDTAGRPRRKHLHAAAALRLALPHHVRGARLGAVRSPLLPDQLPDLCAGDPHQKFRGIGHGTAPFSAGGAFGKIAPPAGIRRRRTAPGPHAAGPRQKTDALPRRRGSRHLHPPLRGCRPGSGKRLRTADARADPEHGFRRDEHRMGPARRVRRSRHRSPGGQELVPRLRRDGAHREPMGHALPPHGFAHSGEHDGP